LTGACQLQSGKVLKLNASETVKPQPLVQLNPFNSTASLKFQKQLTTTSADDEVVVKSLFELHKDKSYKPVEEFKAEISNAQKKPLFNFGESKSSAPVLKPFFNI
jgi:hypothetical protein